MCDGTHISMIHHSRGLSSKNHFEPTIEPGVMVTFLPMVTFSPMVEYEPMVTFSPTLTRTVLPFGFVCVMVFMS